MSSHPLPFLVIWLTTFHVWMPLFAQDRSYHLELSDGTSGWAILVNDSQKKIEAYHFTAKCWSAGQVKGGTEYSYDALESSGTSRSGPWNDVAGIVSHRDVLEPDSRMVSAEKLVPQPSGCVWDAAFDAVIYADGSYSGDTMVVRGLQARRDGIAESLKYWTNRLSHEAVDKASLETIRADAERMKEEDRKKTVHSQCDKLPISCEYWWGRYQIDSDVTMQTKPWKDGPELNGYGGIIQMYARHEKKIEADVALKKLDAVFPLSEALAQEQNQSRAQ